MIGLAKLVSAMGKKLNAAQLNWSTLLKEHIATGYYGYSTG